MHLCCDINDLQISADDSGPEKTKINFRKHFSSGDHDDAAALQDFARIDGAAAAAEEEELRAEGGDKSLAAKEEVTLPATLDVANTHLRYEMKVFTG